MGRREDDGVLCYFHTPTPGSAHGEGTSGVSAEPAFLTAEGVYETEQKLSVELQGSDIRYTLDGSEPTWDSMPYEGPIVLTAPAVIRAASFTEGKLPSRTVTASYLLGISHELPVLSLAVDPEQMFGTGGMYRNYLTERELPCSLKLFEETGSFTIDCGVKMHGFRFAKEKDP